MRFELTRPGDLAAFGAAALDHYATLPGGTVRLCAGQALLRAGVSLRKTEKSNPSPSRGPAGFQPAPGPCLVHLPWRSERDSNPRGSLAAPTALAGQRHQPARPPLQMAPRIAVSRASAPSSPPNGLGWYPVQPVPKGGVEPPRPLGHCGLNAARLPVSPPGHVDRCQVASRLDDHRRAAGWMRPDGDESGPRNLQPLRAEDGDRTRAATLARWCATSTPHPHGCPGQDQPGTYTAQGPEDPEPEVGFEPTTPSLPRKCSAAELHGRVLTWLEGRDSNPHSPIQSRAACR